MFVMFSVGIVDRFCAICVWLTFLLCIFVGFRSFGSYGWFLWRCCLILYYYSCWVFCWVLLLVLLMAFVFVFSCIVCRCVGRLSWPLTHNDRNKLLNKKYQHKLDKEPATKPNKQRSKPHKRSNKHPNQTLGAVSKLCSSHDRGVSAVLHDNKSATSRGGLNRAI